MGRPRKTDAERFIHAPLPVPGDLTPAQRAVWARDVAPLPPNFFVPADTAALRIYVDIVVEYEHVRSALLRTSGDARHKIAREFRAITALRISCMRGLRLLPHTRLHKSHAATLMNAPTLPPGAEDLPPTERWRALFPPKDRSN